MDESRSLEIDEFFVPSGKVQNEIRIKGSRFICTIIPCLTKEDAEIKYGNVRKKYFDATHNCFAWRIDDLTWRYSDDGEPAGTAGKPILQAIDSRNFKEILCVVTRYFGGTKLGTGGLIRAYNQTAAEALNKVKPKIKTIYSEIIIEYDYALENLVRKILAEFKGKLIQSKYDNSVSMKLALPESKSENFCTKLLEASNSLIKILN